MIFVIINWIGCLLLLFGFILLTLRNPSSKTRKIATLLSLIGTAMVGIWGLSILAWPIIILEGVFTVVGGIQFWRMMKKEKENS
jgi:hypothetical protein